MADPVDKVPDGSSQAGDKPALPTRVPFAAPYPGRTTPPPPRRAPPTIGQILAARSSNTAPTEPGPTITAPPKRKIWVRMLSGAAAAALLVAGALWWSQDDAASTAPSDAGSVPPGTAAQASTGAAVPPSANAIAPPSIGAAAAPSPPTVRKTSAPSSPAAPKASANTSGRNLALRSAATASSVEGAAWAPSNVIDGDPSTRWSSGFSDPQWLRLDLGARWQVSEITLNWENAHATNYRVEVSTDGKAWTAVYRTSAGRSGTVVIDAGKRAARYVRMYGTERSTAYGYSLLEIEVR